MNIALIAAYNESKNIADVVARTRKFVDKVIVVDDGSTDDTSKQARKAGAIVWRYIPNRGKAQVLWSGICKLGELKPDNVVFIDGDGQHSPEDIPSLLNVFKNEKIQVVYAVRKFDLTYFKSWIPGLIADVIFNGNDILCGFKAIRWDLLQNLDLSKADGYLFELELHRQIRERKNIRIASVFIEPIGTTRIGWLKGSKLLMKFIFGDK